ncbi:MAG: TIR domain-containing protein [Anaerolineae bacterium]|nr:TIR domain-containing protein [Anaerolineae bacterium]
MGYIFISHATADDNEVNQIYHALADEIPNKIWVDHRALKPPEHNWRDAIHQALQESDAGLLVLSRNAIHRPEIVSEWSYLLNTGKALYIAKIDDVPVEDIDYRLHIVQWVDISRHWDTGIHVIAQAIRQEAPELPPDPSVMLHRPITGLIPRNLTSIRMSGRESDLEAVTRLLARGPAAILGIGGLGKSRLAAQVVLSMRGIGGAIWHRCSDVSRADEVIELLREHFALPREASEADVMVQLKRHQRLIVFDNAEDVRAGDPRRMNYARLIEKLHAAGAKVLMTSRVAWAEIPLCGEHTPRQLPLEDAAQVVCDMAAVLDVPGLEPRARTIAQASMQHPKLIEWTVGQMKRFEPDKVLRDLHGLRNRSVQDALDEMILKTYTQMCATLEGAMAARALRRMAVCRGGFTYNAAAAICLAPVPAPSHIQEKTYALVDDAPALRDEDDLDEALEMLQTWRFVIYDPARQRHYVDPLVTEVIGTDESARRTHYEYYKRHAQTYHERQDYAGLDEESANLEVAFEWALANGDGRSALRFANTCGNFLANRGRFAQNLDWSERVAEKLRHHPNKSLWANAQNSLGVDYQNLPTGDRRDNLKRAIDCYQAALEYRTATRTPLDFALTQNNLGTAYADLAGMEEEYRAEHLKRAIDCYLAALIYRTADRTPSDYAMTQNNLGNAYADLSTIEERADNLKRAIDCYTAALIYRTPTDTPLDYAMTQTNLGTAYTDLGNIENHTENLQRAIWCYKAALVYCTPDAAPLEYAMTQHNMGIAYADLDETLAALACWREAEYYYRKMGLKAQSILMRDWINSAQDE